MGVPNECYLTEVGYAVYKNGEKLFRRNIYCPYQLVPNYVEQQKDFDVYQCAYRYNQITNISNAKLYGDFYLDLDDDNSFETVRKDAITALWFFQIVFNIDYHSIQIFFSGNKGIHLIVPAECFQLVPTKQLNQIYRLIAGAINGQTPNKTVDLKVYDNKRLFRIPNTIHGKTGLYKIPLTFQELKSISYDDLLILARQKRQLSFQEPKSNPISIRQFEYYIHLLQKEHEQEKSRSSQREQNTLKVIPYCIAYLLEHGAEVGERNLSIACLASFYKSYGKTRDEALSLILEWNSKNTKPTGQMEVQRTVKSIFSSNKRYGCTTMKLLSKCDPSQCKLMKKAGQNHDNS